MLQKSLAVLAALTLFIIAEASTAWFDGWLTLEQMHAQGISQGIFFLGHPGMWMDLLVLNPLLAAITARYKQQWTLRQVYVVGALAFLLSAGMHYQYAQDPFPTAFGHHGLTLAGALHFVYMTIAFTVVALFYVCTVHASKVFIRIASTLLLVHVIVGVYVPLKLWTPDWFPQHGVLNTLTLVPIAGSALFLAGLSWFALRKTKGAKL